MDILAVARQGLQQAGQQVEKSAQRIARAASPSDDMVSLLTNKNQFEADLSLAEMANTMEKKTLDLLA